MTWTYTGTSSTDFSERDQIRFLVGDTDTTDQLVADEEIAFALTFEETVRGAAAVVAESIAGQFARKADKETGKLKIWLSQKAKAYLALATRLRNEDSSRRARAGVPVIGGISESRKETVEDDTDLVVPAFRVGMLDNPRAFRSSGGESSALDEDDL